MSEVKTEITWASVESGDLIGFTNYYFADRIELILVLENDALPFDPHLRIVKLWYIALNVIVDDKIVDPDQTVFMVSKCGPE